MQDSNIRKSWMKDTSEYSVLSLYQNRSFKKDDMKISARNKKS